MTAKTPKDRQRASRDRRRKDGARLFSMMLSPAARAKLDAWRAAGHTATEVVNRLVEASEPAP